MNFGRVMTGLDEIFKVVRRCKKDFEELRFQLRERINEDIYQVREATLEAFLGNLLSAYEMRKPLREYLAERQTELMRAVMEVSNDE